MSSHFFHSRVRTYVCPPHCPYNAEPVPLEAVEVAALVDEVVDEGFTVVIVVETAFDVDEVGLLLHR
jgi:hypothetical protein